MNKSEALYFWGAVLIIIVGVVLWKHHSPVTSVPSSVPFKPPTTEHAKVVLAPSLSPTPPHPNPNNSLSIRIDRQRVLHDHPDLDAEYKSLVQEESELKKQVNLAMLKCNAKIAPIIAKVEQLESPAPKPAQTPIPPPIITPAEWQQLNGARIEAMKSNSDIFAKLNNLRTKMLAFQDRVDAVLVEEYPEIVPLMDIMKYNHTHPESPKPLPPINR